VKCSLSVQSQEIEEILVNFINSIPEIKDAMVFDREGNIIYERQNAVNIATKNQGIMNSLSGELGLIFWKAWTGARSISGFIPSHLILLNIRSLKH
jgi:hypothetical protein